MPELDESEQAPEGGEEGDEDEEPGKGLRGAAEVDREAEGVLEEPLRWGLAGCAATRGGEGRTRMASRPEGETRKGSRRGVGKVSCVGDWATNCKQRGSGQLQGRRRVLGGWEGARVDSPELPL